MIDWFVVVTVCFMGGTPDQNICETHEKKVYEQHLLPHNCMMEGMKLAKEWQRDGWRVSKISCHR